MQTKLQRVYLALNILNTTSVYGSIVHLDYSLSSSSQGPSGFPLVPRAQSPRPSHLFSVLILSQTISTLEVLPSVEPICAALTSGMRLTVLP